MSAPERREPQSEPTRDSRPPSIAPLFVLPSSTSPTPFLFRHFIVPNPHQRPADYPSHSPCLPSTLYPPPLLLLSTTSISSPHHLALATTTPCTPAPPSLREPASVLLYVFPLAKVWVHTEPIPRRTRRCYPLENSGGVVN